MVLFAHYWHKYGVNGVLPSGYLGEEAWLGEQCHLRAGEPVKVGSQLRACISDVLQAEVMANRTAVFQVST